MKYPGILILSVFFLILLPGNSPGEESVWWELVEQANRNGDYGSALDYLSRMEMKDPHTRELARVKVSLLNRLGNKYYRERDIPRARDTFLEALYIDPANFVTLRMLGEIAYFTQNLEEAGRYWEEALSLQPDDSTLKTLLNKLKKEKKVEGGMDSSSLANFDIRYHGGDPNYNIYDIQGNLLEAYQEIGYDFNYYPTSSIVVLLYTKDEFSRLRNTPNWVGALYDGKIRLPIPGDELDAAEIKNILWHEYTHSLINDETGNNCPRWLHEGLAQYQQAKIIPVDQRVLDYALRDDRLIPLARLDRAFGFNQSRDKVRLAYAQAYSLTSYLIERYGFWRINVILQSLKKGRGWKQVFEEELLLPVRELENEWREAI
ncbi:MAG: peptidase MA family metallohydrolase [Candidatus Auribacterota bacterium]|nr:peptidase MA family metallohydrolase [Candidatus Auribacterota bacterium]